MTSTQTNMTSTQTLPSDFMTAEPTQDTTPTENTSPIDSGRLRAQLEESLKLAKTAVRVAAENRGQDILCLDLSEQTSLFDYFVIATGASRRQLSAMATEIDRAMKTEFNERKLSVSGLEESRWIVLDYGSIVVHLFDEETREFYDLESLWGDARQVGVSEVVAAATTQMARINTIENPADPT